MVRLKIGYASAGDVRTFENLLTSLGVSYTEKDGYITTGEVTPYQRSVIEAKAKELIVPCVVIEEKPVEPVDDYKDKYEALKEEYDNFRKYVSNISKELEALLK